MAEADSYQMVMTTQKDEPVKDAGRKTLVKDIPGGKFFIYNGPEGDCKFLRIRRCDDNSIEHNPFETGHLAWAVHLPSGELCPFLDHQAGVICE